IEKEVLPALVERTVERFGHVYTELVENRAYVEQVASSEEARFAGTLRQGVTLFETEIGKAAGGQKPRGDVVFKLHDTFGFPKELTSELAAEAGFEIDDERFEALMEEQRGRGKRSAQNGRVEEELAAVAGEAGTSEFVGYQTLESDGRLLALIGPGGRGPGATGGGGGG